MKSCIPAFKSKSALLRTLICASLLSTSALALAGPEQPTAPALSKSEHKIAITTAAKQLRENYVFADRGAKYAAALDQAHKKGQFSSAQNGPELAKALTLYLREISQDKHMMVDFSPEPLPQNLEPETLSETELQEATERAKWLNFAISAVQRLPCNIGYLNLRGFAGEEGVEAALAAAMSLLSRTDALIIDLRENGGGSPDTVALLASYLFDTKTQLNSIINPQVSKEPTEFWTRDTLTGPRYGAKRPVYVLTSADTFSAAEDFSYAVKNLKRATLIGETTGGGAHPVRPYRLSDHLAMMVPFARSESPITKTDWEGVGVDPDLKTAAGKALDRAQVEILRQLAKTEKREPRLKGMQGRLAELEKAL